MVDGCNLPGNASLKRCLLLEHTGHGVWQECEQGQSNYDNAQCNQTSAPWPEGDGRDRPVSAQMLKRVASLQFDQGGRLVAELPGRTQAIMQCQSCIHQPRSTSKGRAIP